jgi:hypothetical protein
MEYLKGKSGAWGDITNNKYGLLTVLGYVGEGKWHCICECKEEKIVKTARLTTGHVKSCGCLTKTNAVKHNAIKTKEYMTWTNIKARCNNPNNTAYKNYGARGIVICKEWLNSFENFFKDMGECPIGFSIERIDNDKGYTKDNCIWASPKIQAMNRRSNFIVTYKGKEKPLKQWCDDLNLNYKKVFARIRQLGWTVDKALSSN